MAKQLGAPVKEVVFSWLHLSGPLQLRRRIYKPALPFTHGPEKSVKFRGIRYLQQVSQLKLSLRQHSRLDCRKRQIVSIGVRGWLDLLGFLQERNGFGKSTELD